MLKSSRALSAHVRGTHNGWSAQSYYDAFLRGKGGVCSVCGAQTAFKGIAQGYCEFCSYEHAEAVRVERISETKKGRPNVALRGYKQTHEHIKKRTKAGSRGMRGSKHPNWKGGVARLGYPWRFFQIRNLVRLRDGECCILCGRSHEDSGRALSVHHIDEDKNNNDLTNLITLCTRCHRKAHSRTTEEMRFDLKDAAGSPTETSLFERVRV